MAQLEIGGEFARHRIEGVAGRGGMGVVYRATDLALDRTVALKVIAADLAEDDEFRTRFQSESRAAASLRHPNILTIFGAGEERGIHYVTMQLVEGQDLGNLIAAKGRLEPRTAARITAQIGSALDVAHAAGLAHRDVKPANILLQGEGESLHCYLTDFGLARKTASAARLTKSGQWIGTLDYIAPEQIEGGPTDGRADVYSLGCVLTHALTGKVPFARETDAATIYAHLEDPPPRPSVEVPGVPAQLDGVVGRSLAKRPADRYPSAGDLGFAAVEAAAGRTTSRAERSVAIGSAAPGSASAESASEPAKASAAPSPQAAPPEHSARRFWVAAAAVAAGIAAALLVATGTIGGGEDTTTSQVSTQVSTTDDDTSTTETDDPPTDPDPPTDSPGVVREEFERGVRSTLATQGLPKPVIECIVGELRESITDDEILEIGLSIETGDGLPPEIEQKSIDAGITCADA